MLIQSKKQEKNLKFELGQKYENNTCLNEQLQKKNEAVENLQQCQQDIEKKLRPGHQPNLTE